MDEAVRTRGQWTEVDDAHLRELVSENLSYAEIGVIMGRNKNSCIGRAHRLGIKSSDTKPRPAPKPAEKGVEKLFARPAVVEAVARYEQPEASTTAFGVPRTLMGLLPHHCRFPVRGDGAETLFCCGRRDGTKPYCLEHSIIAFRPTERQSLARIMKAYR